MINLLNDINNSYRLRHYVIQCPVCGYWSSTYTKRPIVDLVFFCKGFNCGVSRHVKHKSQKFVGFQVNILGLDTGGLTAKAASDLVAFKNGENKVVGFGSF